MNDYQAIYNVGRTSSVLDKQYTMWEGRLARVTSNIRCGKDVRRSEQAIYDVGRTSSVLDMLYTMWEGCLASVTSFPQYLFDSLVDDALVGGAVGVTMMVQR